ncbi:PQQ-binding-like beta-propeller repeat protein [Actinotalea sp. K2]|uniref:outer membrane protein assembly factor BamB family protein n=1 Tax=Actinotalea sp. K2 TaxID=2939438 RepID=UPI00201724B6|nr:PQQ-binding-like beta-propeller repeat protein [Actinotalea sp. K2]MCL3860615.1 PQQ-binding-like beta-propeller repeat protein [Actinotalea sp. K2]
MRQHPTAGPGAEHVVEVELVEDDSTGPPDERAGDGPPGAAPRSVAGNAPGAGRERSGRRGGLRARHGVVAVVALALVLATVVQVRQEAASRAALAAVPGVLSPMVSPPRELWRVASVDGQAEVAGDLLLLTDSAGARLRAVDPSNGQERWQHDWGQARPGSGGGSCSDVAGFGTATGPSYARGQETHAQDVAPRILCLRAQPEFAGNLIGLFPPTVVVVLSGTDGEVVARREVRGNLLLVRRIGDDLLLAWAGSEGGVTVVRQDLRTGEDLWVHRSEPGVLGSEGGAQFDVVLHEDVLTLTSRGAFSVEIADGAPLGPADEAPRPGPDDLTWVYAQTVLPDGHLVRWGARTATFSTVEVTAPDGRAVLRVTGDPAWPLPHDGSVPDVLVVVAWDRSALEGYDVRSGDLLWSVEAASTTDPVAQLDGRLFLVEDDQVRAVDVHDGTTVWRAAVDPLLAWSVATDGRSLLVPVPRGQGGSAQLAALRLDDGTERWRTELPRGTQRLAVAADRLVAVTGSVVVGLG